MSVLAEIIVGVREDLARRRSAVPFHPAPTRRRVDRSTGEARGTVLALRRWR